MRFLSARPPLTFLQPATPERHLGGAAGDSIHLGRALPTLARRQSESPELQIKIKLFQVFVL
jgi:hypothetical protein